MDNASFLLLTRQLTILDSLDNISNNIAHTDSVGFKKDMMMYNQRMTKDVNPEKLYFPRAVLTIPDFSSGSIYITNNALDLALEDDIDNISFFMIQGKDGIKYTRNGKFHTDSNFRIVDVKNNPVLSQDGDEIILDPQDSDIVVMADGTILTPNGELSVIGVVSFDANESELIQKDDDGYFTSAAIVNDDNNYKILQGALENSNSDTIASIGELLRTQPEMDLTAKLQEDLYKLRRKTYEYFSTISGG